MVVLAGKGGCRSLGRCVEPRTCHEATRSRNTIYAHEVGAFHNTQCITELKYLISMLNIKHVFPAVLVLAFLEGCLSAGINRRPCPNVPAHASRHIWIDPESRYQLLSNSLQAQSTSKSLSPCTLPSSPSSTVRSWLPMRCQRSTLKSTTLSTMRCPQTSPSLWTPNSLG